MIPEQACQANDRYTTLLLPSALLKFSQPDYWDPLGQQVCCRCIAAQCFATHTWTSLLLLTITLLLDCYMGSSKQSAVPCNHLPDMLISGHSRGLGEAAVPCLMQLVSAAQTESCLVIACLNEKTQLTAIYLLHIRRCLCLSFREGFTNRRNYQGQAEACNERK